MQFKMIDKILSDNVTKCCCWPRMTLIEEKHLNMLAFY